jgi:hypothetical protein
MPFDVVLIQLLISALQVLILLPTRNLALRLVLRLCQLAQKENRSDSIQNKQRFIREFGVGEEGEDGGQESKAAKGPGGLKAAAHATLLEENDDDNFRIGIKITKWVEPLSLEGLSARGGCR